MSDGVSKKAPGKNRKGNPGVGMSTKPKNVALIEEPGNQLPGPSRGATRGGHDHGDQFSPSLYGKSHVNRHPL